MSTGYGSISAGKVMYFSYSPEHIIPADLFAINNYWVRRWM